MSKIKKNQKHHPIEDILFAGERIVWQGKPNASTLEYIRQHIPESPTVSSSEPTIITLIIDRLLLFYSKKREARLSDYFIALISTITSIWILTIFSAWLDRLPSDTIGILFFVSVFFLAPLFYVIVSVALQKLFGQFEKLIWRIFEKRYAIYFITNKRVIVYNSRTFYRFVYNNAIQYAVIHHSEQGAVITWFELANKQPAIPQFIGLSEFDVNHVLNTVDEQINTTFYVVDERAKVKTRQTF